VLTSLTDHQLLVFWVQLFVLLAVARTLGGLMRRLGQPSVIGELAAGVLLGPSVFGKVWTDGFDWFLPSDPAQSAALLAIGWVGVVFLLIITGFETDFELIRSRGRAAAFVAGGGQVVPFAFGFTFAWFMPEVFIGDEATRTVFVLFIAVAMSISALPVIATILRDLGMMRRNFAQTTLAAGMADDLVGWVAIGLIAGLAASGSISVGGVAFRIAGIVAFFVFAFTLGQRCVDAGLKRVRRRGPNVQGALAFTLMVALAAAVATQALHVEAPLGAFIAGILLGRSRFQDERVVGHLEQVTRGFLAPVFFATAGLRVDLEALREPTVLFWTAVVLLIACVGKFSGAFLGSKLAGLTNRDGLAIGASLNARGAIEIVVATIGLSLGILSTAGYTVIVVMALITTAMAPPILRWVVRDWRGDDDEERRLEREESMARNIVVRNSRILLPSRGGPGSIAAAQVLHFAWPDEAAVTVIAVGEEEPALDPIANVFHEREVDIYRVRGDGNPLDRILSEGHLGYGVMGVGVADVTRAGPLLSPFVDGLINESPLPLVIVRSARNLESRLPPAFTRAFVPVSGGRSSRAAQEIAFNISCQLGTDVVLSHVVTERSTDRAGFVPSLFRPGSTGPGSDNGVAERLLGQAVALAAELGVDTQGHVVRGRSSPGEEIVTAAREAEADLIVLGAHARRLEGRPYLGANVEHVLEDSDATVVVVILPDEGS
jgi:Kef-type K+ transport system membrane component KefB/nucleotide-binding universal stress UspA family protein